MMKKIVFSAVLLAIVAWSGAAAAEEMRIQDYVFTWHVAKVGSVSIRVEKTQEHLWIIVGSPGGKIASVALTPSQAKVIGEILVQTQDYYDRLMKNKRKEVKEVVPAGDYRVTFSKEGRDFEVKIDRPKAFSSAVLLFENQAPEVGEWLLKSEAMAELTNRKVNP
ncbi:MAG: hypothetical protein JRJ60_20770 [Deltaproteobacteria bacterium]|nr:hypothetical protein [Deltaproteobacteria bacterium]